jgi:hypothetical protein
MSLFFSVFTEHIDALLPFWHKFKSSILVAVGSLYLQPLTKHHFHFLIGVPTWYEFKNSVAIDIGFLRSQPLTNADFCFLIVVESATFELLLELL